MNANYVYGNFLHCDIKGSCNTYDHIIIGSKVDKCTEDLLIKYQKGGKYIMAFLNDNGYIVNQSILKNCSSQTEVKFYNNFVAYCREKTIFISIFLSEYRSTTQKSILDLEPISSPLNVRDIERIENGVTKVLNKFNIEKTCKA